MEFQETENMYAQCLVHLGSFLVKFEMANGNSLVQCENI